MASPPTAKRLRDLLVDFYMEHDPEKLRRGLDINGIVMWTGRNGIDALNEVLRNQTGHELDLDKNLGGAKKIAARVSMVFNPNKPAKVDSAEKERELFSRLHFFYMRNDPGKLANIHKLHQFAMYHGEEELNVKLRKKYGKSLPREMPKIERQANAGIPGATTIVVKEALAPVPKEKPGPGKKRRRNKKGKNDFEISAPVVHSGPKITYGGVPDDAMSRLTAHLPPRTAAPAAPPKIETPARTLPPLPPKKVIPPLPNKVGLAPPLGYESDGSDFTVDDYDPKVAAKELTDFFNFHDPEQVEELEQYLDLYYNQGRDQLNMTLGNLYGMNLDEFLENPPSKEPQFMNEHFSFMGAQSVAGHATVRPGGPLGGIVMNRFEPNRGQPLPQREEELISFAGVAGVPPPVKPKSVNYHMAGAPPSEEEVFDYVQPKPPPEVRPKTPRFLPPLPSGKPKTSTQGKSKHKRGTKKGSVHGSDISAAFEEANSEGPSSRKKRGGFGETLKKMGKSMRIKSMRGGMMKGLKNIAGNRFSLSPNANKPVRAPIEATPDQGACENYRLDMLGKTIGVCVCGFPRADHSYAAKFGAPRKNAWKNVSAKINPSNVQHNDQKNLFKNFDAGKAATSSPVWQKPAFGGDSKKGRQFEEIRMSQLEEENDEPESPKMTNAFNSSFLQQARKAVANYETPYDKSRKNARTQTLDESRQMYLKKSTSTEIVNSINAQPCDNFRMDINGKFHGDCVCGFSRMKHTKKKGAFESDKKLNTYQASLQRMRDNLGKSQSAVQKSPGIKIPSKWQQRLDKYKDGNSSSMDRGLNNLASPAYLRSKKNNSKDVPGIPKQNSRTREAHNSSGKDGKNRASDPGDKKFCHTCSLQYNSNFKYCGQCGTKL